MSRREGSSSSSSSSFSSSSSSSSSSGVVGRISAGTTTTTTATTTATATTTTTAINSTVAVTGVVAGKDARGVQRRRRREMDFAKLASEERFVVHHSDSAHDFWVEFNGPVSTPYAGGLWALHVSLPADYPFKSPSIGFSNRIFHPNVDEISGSVCLDVINQTWTPLYELANVFDTFLPQLLRYPNPSDPLNPEAAALQLRDPVAYASKVQAHVRRYASLSECRQGLRRSGVLEINPRSALAKIGDGDGEGRPGEKKQHNGAPDRPVGNNGGNGGDKNGTGGGEKGNSCSGGSSSSSTNITISSSSGGSSSSCSGGSTSNDGGGGVDDNNVKLCGCNNGQTNDGSHHKNGNCYNHRTTEDENKQQQRGDEDYEPDAIDI